jgi:hypothetical protein
MDAGLVKEDASYQNHAAQRGAGGARTGVNYLYFVPEGAFHISIDDHGCAWVLTLQRSTGAPPRAVSALTLHDSSLGDSNSPPFSLTGGDYKVTWSSNDCSPLALPTVLTLVDDNPSHSYTAQFQLSGNDTTTITGVPGGDPFHTEAVGVACSWSVTLAKQ